MSVYRIRLGVVGFSSKHFDQVAATKYLEEGLCKILEQEQARAEEIELVSGLTNMGVPRLAYELAVSKKIRTIGISAEQAKRFSRFPVDRIFYFGKKFGDESDDFIAYITHLLRVGGGPQSRREVELFKAKHALDPDLLARNLIEYEVEWFGPPKK